MLDGGSLGDHCAFYFDLTLLSDDDLCITIREYQKTYHHELNGVSWPDIEVLVLGIGFQGGQ